MTEATIHTSATKTGQEMAQSNEFQFLLQLSDGRVRICDKQLENMDPSCLVSGFQDVGDSMVWRITTHTWAP